jgi:cytochrome c biogenesis factor
MRIFGAKTRKAGVITAKTFKILFLTGSILLLAWIAYCLGILTADFLSFRVDDHSDDVKTVLIEC